VPNPTRGYTDWTSMVYPLEQMRDHPRSLVHRLVGHLETGVAGLVSLPRTQPNLEALAGGKCYEPSRLANKED
jgi:hypothetical protein